MKRVWTTVSAICGVVALVLMIQREFDAAFTVAAIGAVAWFLGYRVHMKGFVDLWDDSHHHEQDEEDDWHHH